MTDTKAPPPQTNVVGMDEEDRTPLPAGYDADQWRKADEVHHATALVANDTECVKIIYAALLSAVRDGVEEALQIATDQTRLMADLAVEGLPENARNREAMEAALTRFADNLRVTLEGLTTPSLQPKTIPTGIVSVCPECDIAGCKHLRFQSKPLRIMDADNAEAGARAVSDILDKLAVINMDAPLNAIDRLRAFAGDSKDITFDTDDADEILEYLEILAATAPQNQLRVKQLDWKSGYSDGTVQIQNVWPIPFYQVRVLNGVVWLDVENSQTVYPSVDEAKSAAQADYETRIRAALATSEGSADV